MSGPTRLLNMAKKYEALGQHMAAIRCLKAAAESVSTIEEVKSLNAEIARLSVVKEATTKKQGGSGHD